MLAHGVNASAQIARREPSRRRGGELARAPAEAVGARRASESSEARARRIELLQQRQDLVPDQAPLRAGFDESSRYGSPRSSQHARTSSRQTASSGRTTPSSRLRLDPLRRRARRRGRAAPTRPGRRRCGRSREAGRSRRSSGGRVARPRSSRATSASTISRRKPRGRSARPRRTRHRATRARRAARRPRSRARPSACQRQVESAPPETRQGTSPPGSIRPCSRMKPSTRSRAWRQFALEGGRREPTPRALRAPVRSVLALEPEDGSRSSTWAILLLGGVPRSAHRAGTRSAANGRPAAPFLRAASSRTGGSRRRSGSTIVGAVLTTGGGSVERPSADDPLEIDGERAAFELAVARVVQLRDDDERHVTAARAPAERFRGPARTR